MQRRRGWPTHLSIWDPCRVKGKSSKLPDPVEVLLEYLKKVGEADSPTKYNKKYVVPPLEKVP